MQRTSQETKYPWTFMFLLSSLYADQTWLKGNSIMRSGRQDPGMTVKIIFYIAQIPFYMSDDKVKHFQRHWTRGEPMIVRNVLDRTSGLSWEPMVMWRALRETGSRVKYREETQCVKAIDCLDWFEVDINVHQFFASYLEGRMHKDRWPEILKLKDWPSSTSFEERLPRHGAEFQTALPLWGLH